MSDKLFIGKFCKNKLHRLNETNLGVNLFSRLLINFLLGLIFAEEFNFVRKKLQHFPNDAFQSYYDLFQVN